MTQITFRPHHFLCALCFKGNGYSSAFVANFEVIMAALNASDGDHTAIYITQHTDSICDPCPNRRNTTCTSEEKISTLDNAHAKALDIHAGEIITWGNAKKRIKEKMTLDTFHQICKTCSWKEFGICEGVISEFLKTS